jgi:hypothetical protein
LFEAERRKYKRYPCELVIIDHETSCECNVLDISLNGARLLCKEDSGYHEKGLLRKGKMVLSRILPGHADINLSCKIRWVYSHSEELLTGVEFFFLEMKDMMTLNFLISNQNI